MGKIAKVQKTIHEHNRKLTKRFLPRNTESQTFNNLPRNRIIAVIVAILTKEVTYMFITINCLL